MSSFADRHERDQERLRDAVARVCGVFGHELNNIAMLILAQSRNLESQAEEPGVGLAARRLQEIALELGARLDELARAAARFSSRRERLEPTRFLTELARELAAEDPARPALAVAAELGAAPVAISLDDRSLGLAVTMLLDHLSPIGTRLEVAVGRGSAREQGLAGPPGREVALIRFSIADAEVDRALVAAADSSAPDIVLGLDGPALALALLKATARRAQGRLSSRYAAGRLELMMILPIHVDVPDLVAAGPGKLPERPAATRRVLLVEDDFHVRQVTVSIFDRLGFEVIAVAGLAEANDVLASDRELALIVSDYVLPKGRDGELLEEARRLRPETPLLCVSGLDVGAKVGAAFPATRFLRKPFTLGDVRDALVAAGLLR